jgi:phenylacetate-CoA ligase
MIKEISSLLLFLSLKKSQWNLELLEKIKEKKLRYIINYVYHNIPYYHKKWKKIGIKPEEIKNTEDLRKLPTISKDEVIKNYNDFFPKWFNPFKVKKIQTSGTTGTPFQLFIDDSSCVYRDTMFLRCLSSLGYNYRDLIAYYWYEELEKRFYHRLGFLRKVTMLSSWGDEVHIRKLISTYPNILIYFPNRLIGILKKMKKEGACLNPRFVITQGELLTKNMRKIIETILNTDVYDVYGTVEMGIIAWQCQEKNAYHINEEMTIVETLKNEENVVSELGEIVTTSTVNYVFPLIRYRTGDVGILSDEKCTCGRKLPLLKKIEGRKNEFFVLSKIHKMPSELIDFFYNIPEVYRFQIFLNKDNIKKVRIIPASWDEKTEKKIKEKIQEINIKIEISKNKKIEVSKGGKICIFKL